MGPPTLGKVCVIVTWPFSRRPGSAAHKLNNKAQPQLLTVGQIHLADRHRYFHPWLHVGPNPGGKLTEFGSRVPAAFCPHVYCEVKWKVTRPFRKGFTE